MTKNKFIIPAIIAKNQEELNKSIQKVNNFVDIIQLDFMDGEFVPNNSIDFDFKLPKVDCSYEAHLMVKKPEQWIDKHLKKVDTVLIHYESDYKKDKVIDKVKKHGKKIGFVLNPETPVNKLSSFIDDIDQVLIMTVKPGFYGSSFLPEMVDKISKLRKIKPDINIEVDGGITNKTIKLVNNAGANMFVSGSYIMKAENIKKAVDNLKKII